MRKVELTLKEEIKYKVICKLVEIGGNKNRTACKIGCYLLNRFRIEKTAALLLNTDMKVAEIAAACGFSDISYFAKIFRRQKSHTPTEYRRCFKA